MNNERCENCRFHDRGVCKLLPPVVVLTSTFDRYVTKSWRQPDVAYDDWCGQWEAKRDE